MANANRARDESEREKNFINLSIEMRPSMRKCPFLSIETQSAIRRAYAYMRVHFEHFLFPRIFLNGELNVQLVCD